MGCADNANAVKNTNADKSADFNIVLIVYENSQVNVLTLPFANEVIYYLSLKIDFMRFIALLLMVLATNVQAQTLTGIFNDKEFSMIFPLSWDTGHFTNIPVIYAPEESAKDGFRDNINITSEKGAGVEDLTIDEYIKISIDNLEPTLGDEIKSIKVSPYAVGKYKAEGRVITYNTTKFTDDGTELSLWQAIVKEGRKFYVITYTSTPDYFNKYFKEVEDMVSTLRFKM